jgi:DinB superfamily
MNKSSNSEYWLRGPVPGIPSLLQPVAHALLQSREEVNVLMEGFPGERLWERPAGVASPGFHLQHLAGVLDRLLTYARGETLSARQLGELGAEGGAGEEDALGANGELAGLLERYNRQVDNALVQLAETPELSLTEARGVGRAQIPSTVGGLLFHAAEHSMRHTGQLLVTVKILASGSPAGNR